MSPSPYLLVGTRVELICQALRQASETGGEVCRRVWTMVNEWKGKSFGEEHIIDFGGGCLIKCG